MTSNRLAITAAAAVLIAAPAAAQVPLTPRALGMGNAYVGVARGHEALFQNPANLALPGSPHWSAGIPTFSLGVDTRGVDLSDLADLASYDELSDEERNELLAGIPAGGTGVDFDFRAPLAVLQIRRVAVGVGYGVVGNHTLNKSIVDLVLNGFDRNKTYTFDNTEGFRASFWDVAAAYGHRVGPVSVGATAHYYIAGDLARTGVVDTDTTFTTVQGFRVPTDVRVTYAGTRSEGGNGFGLDLGAAMEPIPGLTVSATLQNAINTLAYDEEIRVRTVTLDRNDYENGDPQAVLDRYNESEREYNQAQDVVLPFSRLADSIRDLRDQGLPATLRMGAAYQLRTGTTLAAAFQTELDETAYGGLWDRQLSIGAQQRLAFLGLRAGLATDMEDGSMLSGGLSVGPVHFGVARIRTGTGDDERSGWIGSFGFGGRSDSVMP